MIDMSVWAGGRAQVEGGLVSCAEVADQSWSPSREVLTRGPYLRALLRPLRSIAP